MPLGSLHRFVDRKIGWARNASRERGSCARGLDESHAIGDETHEHPNAEWDQVVVEVEVRMVAAGGRLGAVREIEAARAQKEVRAGGSLGEKREVFGRRHRQLVAADARVADDATGHAGDGRGATGFVDQHRVLRAQAGLDLDAVGRGDPVTDLAKAALDPNADARVEAADGAPKAGASGDDVVRLAGVEGPYGDHGGIRGRELSRHEGLERLDQSRSGNDRIAAALGLRTVPTFAADDRLELVDLRHRRPGDDPNLALGKAGPVVQAIDLVDPVEGALVDHHPGTTTVHAFFGRLEDQPHAAGDLSAMSGQQRGGAQQDRRMAVVSALVRDPVVDGAVGQIGVFAHGERVEIGSQGDARGQSRAALAGRRGCVRIRREVCDQPGARAIAGRVAEPLEPAANQSLSSVLLETQLGVLMDVVSKLAELGCEFPEVGVEMRPGHERKGSKHP